MEDPLLPNADVDRQASTIRESDGTPRRFVAEDLLSPLLGTTVLLPFAVGFAGVIVAANPVLAPHTPTLLSTVIISQGVGAFWFSYFSQFVTCTNIDLLSAAYFGQLGIALRRQAYYERSMSDDNYHINKEDEGLLLLVQILLSQALFTIIVGLLLVAVAKFNGVWYLRYLPYPVACGFVSGIGLIVLDGGFELGCGLSMKDMLGHGALVPYASWCHAGATVIVGCFFLGLEPIIKNATRLPVGLLCVTLAVHGGAQFLNISEETLDHHGVFLQGLQQESWTAGWSAMIQKIGDVDFSLFFSQGCLSLTLSYALLHLMSYPFYAIGMQDVDQPKEKFDARKEILQLGLLNLGVGIVGGVPSCHSYKVCIVMKRSGAKTRLWVVLLGLTFLALYFDTAIRPKIAVVPKCAFGGLVFSLGVDFISASLLESRQRVAQQEWRAVVMTALMTYYDVLAGLVFGSLLTMGLFVVEYAGITGVVNQATFVEVRSLLKRPKEDQELLTKHGLEGVIFWCSGYIFFGTAAGIVEEVEEYLDANPSTRHVVVDFEAVPAVDASGVHALTEFAARCGARKPRVRVCFCGLVRRLNLALKNVIAAKAISDPPRLYSRRVEEAMEWVEGEILRRSKPAKQMMREMTFEPVLTPMEGETLMLNWLCKMMHELAPATSREEVQVAAARLAPCTQLLSYHTVEGAVAGARADQNAGVIFVEGACAYDMFYIISGSADILRSLEGEQTHKLPRHHLNTQKGDHFVFEERTEVRVEQLHEGSILGATEFGAAYGEDVQSVSSRPRRTSTALAAPRCKALRIPFNELHAAFSDQPAMGHRAMTRLCKIAAAQVLELMKNASVKPYRVAASEQQGYTLPIVKEGPEKP